MKILTKALIKPSTANTPTCSPRNNIQRESYEMKQSILFFILIYIASFHTHANSTEQLIPRSSPEKCKYYLVHSENKNGILRATSKQVCPKNKFYSGVGFSVIDIDCNQRKYKTIGYGDDSISNVKTYSSTKWAHLVSGSSKYDLVNFVCK